MKRCEITAMSSRGVNCNCGWYANLDEPQSYGSKAAKDALLDLYLLHQKNKAQRAGK